MHAGYKHNTCCMVIDDVRCCIWGCDNNIHCKLIQWSLEGGLIMKFSLLSTSVLSVLSCYDNFASLTTAKNNKVGLSIHAGCLGRYLEMCSVKLNPFIISKNLNFCLNNCEMIRNLKFDNWQV